MNKRTYYKVVSPSYTSRNGKVKKIYRTIWFEVIVTGHKNGICDITPVSGYGTMKVKSGNLKIV